MSHLDQTLLHDLALGAPGSELDVAHVERCSECRRTLDELRQAWARFASAQPPCAPPPALRATLLAEIEGGHRYAPFTSRVAKLFAIEEARAVALLARAADPASFRAQPVAGVTLASAEVGAPLGAARACFLRAAPGTRYPRHEHGGEERVLVLEGGFRDDAGHEAHAGDLELSPAGSTHAFVVLEDAPCVSAIISTGPLRLVG